MARKRAGALRDATPCAEWLKALANRTCLAAVEAPRGGPKHVGILVQFLNVEQSQMSHHVRTLREADLVETERDGKSVLDRPSRAVARLPGAGSTWGVANSGSATTTLTTGFVVRRWSGRINKLFRYSNGFGRVRYFPLTEPTSSTIRLPLLMDLDQCACSGKSLGRLVQPAIMAVLAAQPVHGYLIIQRLSAMEMFRCQAPDPTGVYRVLRSMEEDGLVVSTWDFGDAGPAKRRFELTADGRACFARWTQTVEQYSAAINDLLAVMKHSVDARPRD